MPRRDDARYSPSQRLVLVIGSLGIGGGEKQLTQLLVRLPRERFQPLLLMTGGVSAGTRLEEAVVDAGVPVVRLKRPVGDPVGRRVRLVRAFDAALRAARPDLVYAWLDEAGALAAPVCRWRGIRCVVARGNITGSAMEQRNPWIALALRRAEAMAGLVTVNSRAMAVAAAARGHDPSRIRIVPNGHERVSPLPSPPAPPVVFGYVAQLREGKGHRRLIDVVQRLRPGGWRVDIAGGGPLRSELEAEIGRRGLKERVRLLGQVDDVRSFWRQRHVGLLLSDSEGSPNALLESAMAGRPAIATAVGGTPELIGRGGILVSPHDPAAIVAAMLRMIEDPDAREAMGRHAWDEASNAFSMAAMLDGHLGALAEAASLPDADGRLRRALRLRRSA